MGEGSGAISFDMPGHHRRWVRLGLCLACLAYVSLTVLHLIRGEAHNYSELVALGICLVALYFTGDKPALAGSLGLFAIWLEIIYSLLTEHAGFRAIAVMVFPPIIVGASQLLGARGGWSAALGTGVAVPVAIYLQSVLTGSPLHPRFFNDLVVFELALLATAALIGSFFRTIESLLLRERQNAEHAQDLAVQLERSQRMETVGKLAGGVAHDFNNLLTAIVGSADLLREQQDPEVRQVVQELEAATDRGSALTRQLLTFARRDVVQERSVDIGATISNLRRLISRMLGDAIVLHVDVEEDCTVLMDEGQLEQIVLNLATNAQEAISTTGTFQLQAKRNGDQVLLTAKDDGPGMSREVAARAFEPFFSTKPRNKGSGLGLSTVHGIVTQWGGRISVDSEPGAGVTIVLSLPYAAANPSTHGQVEHCKEPAQSERSQAILFVEDDPIARRSVSRMLSRGHYDVVVAADGEEAWRLWEDGLRPALLVSDVIMPGITGAELATRMRREEPELPLLLISGYLDDVLEDSPFDTTNELLLKPFTTEELLHRIDEKLSESDEQPESERRRVTA